MNGAWCKERDKSITNQQQQQNAQEGPDEADIDVDTNLPSTSAGSRGTKTAKLIGPKPKKQNKQVVPPRAYPTRKSTRVPKPIKPFNL